jgi:hypothetical protein
VQVPSFVGKCLNSQPTSISLDPNIRLTRRSDASGQDLCL